MLALPGQLRTRVSIGRSLGAGYEGGRQRASSTTVNGYTPTSRGIGGATFCGRLGRLSISRRWRGSSRYSVVEQSAQT